MMERYTMLMKRRRNGSVDSMQTPQKLLPGMFVEIDKLILKFTWKCKGLKIPKQFWKRTTNLEDFSTDLKINSQTVCIGIGWTNRSMMQNKESKNRSANRFHEKGTFFKTTGSGTTGENWNYWVNIVGKIS